MIQLAKSGTECCIRVAVNERETVFWKAEFHRGKLTMALAQGVLPFLVKTTDLYLAGLTISIQCI